MTGRSAAPMSTSGSTSMRMAVICKHRLWAKCHRKLPTTDVTQDRAVAGKRSAKTAGSRIAQNEQQPADRRPDIRHPVDGAARHVLPEEEVAIEDRHGLMLVARWPPSSRVPVVEPGLGREHELPAPRHSIRELHVFTECVAVESLVEDHAVHHLSPLGH